MSITTTTTTTTTRALRRLGRTVALAAAAAVGLAACDDPTTIDEHFEVEGFALFEGTQELYRYTLDDGTPSALTLAQGVHDVVFVLLGPDGQPISEDDHDEAHDDEHELRITIGDPGILAWTPEADDGEQAHDFVEFHGELNAIQAGGTTMIVCVPHGEHCDFEANVPVTVTAP